MAIIYSDKLESGAGDGILAQTDALYDATANTFQSELNKSFIKKVTGTTGADNVLQADGTTIPIATIAEAESYVETGWK